MTDSLKACPFCRRTDTLILLWASEQEGDDWDGSNDDCVQVICDASTDGRKGGCGSSSGFRRTIEEAETLWNTRADSGEAVAWLVTDGSLFVDKAFTTKAHAERSVSDRKDGAHIDPLFTHPRATAVDVRDAERYRWLRGLPRNYDGRKNGFHVTLAIAKDEPNAWFIEAARDLKLDEAIDAAIASREGRGEENG